MSRALWLALLATACHAQPSAAPRGDSPGDRLESAARAAGLVADPEHEDPVGLYARDSDRVCVVPAGQGAYRIGALVSYDEGQGCVARGTARRSGDRLEVSFGDCRFAARFEGDRIAFPAALPAACDAACTGRASLEAVTVERLGSSASEAAAQHDPRGAALCGSD